MSDIFREVDEDIRNERYKKLWDRYGILVIGAAVLIVLITAGYRGWAYWQTLQAQESGDRFVAAITLADEEKHEEAIAAFTELEADSSGEYPVLAAFRMAAEQAAAGDPDAAIATYQSLVSNSGVPTPIAEMARLRAAMLQTDSKTAEELSAEIGDLAETGNPWRQVAREILGFAAFRENNLQVARNHFNAIMDDQESSASARARAEDMLALIDSRLGPTVETEPAEG